MQWESVHFCQLWPNWLKNQWIQTLQLWFPLNSDSAATISNEFHLLDSDCRHDSPRIPTLQPRFTWIPTPWFRLYSHNFPWFGSETQPLQPHFPLNSDSAATISLNSISSIQTLFSAEFRLLDGRRIFTEKKTQVPFVWLKKILKSCTSVVPNMGTVIIKLNKRKKISKVM